MRASHCLIMFLTAFPSYVAADAVNWSSWRGPANRGSIETGDYPDELDPAEAVWKVELPGRGCSTPIVHSGRIYLTAPVDGKDAALAFDWSGKELWRTVYGQESAGKHRNGSGSNASPVTDGEAIFVYFKSGTLAAINVDGTKRWETNIVERFGPSKLFWDHGTSPVLTQKHVVFARMHNGDSWLAAFDKHTGEIAWKVDRNYTTPIENDHGYTTPLVIDSQGQESLLVWGAEHLTVHSAEDGSVLWTCAGFNPNNDRLWPTIALPVIVEDMVTVAFGRNDKRAPLLFGVRLTGQGDVTATNHVWRRDDISTFVPSPVAYQGRVYLVRDHGEIECLDPTTGQNIWSAELPRSRGKYYASPLIAVGKIYAANENGVVHVGKISNDKFEHLSTHDMGESVIGSPVPAGDRILIRGEGHLFCFGQK